MKEDFEEVYESWSDFFSSLGTTMVPIVIRLLSPFWIIPYAIYKKTVERRKHHVRKKEY